MTNVTEIWKIIPDTDGLYEASSFGNIRRRKSCRLVKPITGKKGYQHCSISIHGNFFYRTIHRMIAKAFIPNPDGKPEVNHKNGIKNDNRVENLEWTTRSENHKHARDTGLIRFSGMDNPESKLNDLFVRVIRDAYKNGHPQATIARYFKVSKTTIFNVVSRKTWTHV